jgi:NADPH:quinone reductase-like Zn-dependent oxidoreductase
MAFPRGSAFWREGSGLRHYRVTTRGTLGVGSFRSPASLSWNRHLGLYIAGAWLLPGRKRVVPYSIQWLKRSRPALFRQDLIALFDLLQQQKIKPVIAQRFPLAEARRAHEVLGKGGVIGKIVLVLDGGSLESGAA